MTMADSNNNYDSAEREESTINKGHGKFQPQIEQRAPSFTIVVVAVGVTPTLLGGHLSTEDVNSVNLFRISLF